MGIQTGLELAETIEENCAKNLALDQLPTLIDQLINICESAMDQLKK